jgi:hypothetical protein
MKFNIHNPRDDMQNYKFLMYLIRVIISVYSIKNTIIRKKILDVFKSLRTQQIILPGQSHLITTAHRKIKMNKRRLSVSLFLSLFRPFPILPTAGDRQLTPLHPTAELGRCAPGCWLQTLPTPRCCRQLARAGRRAHAVPRRASSIPVVGEPEEAPVTRREVEAPGSPGDLELDARRPEGADLVTEPCPLSTPIAPLMTPQRRPPAPAVQLLCFTQWTW